MSKLGSMSLKDGAEVQEASHSLKEFSLRRKARVRAVNKEQAGMQEGCGHTLSGGWPQGLLVGTELPSYFIL